MLHHRHGAVRPGLAGLRLRPGPDAADRGPRGRWASAAPRSCRPRWRSSPTSSRPSERGKAIGVWAGGVGLAVAIGPIIGGLLLEHFWWGSVFLINVPIVLIGVVLIALIVPESRDPKPASSTRSACCCPSSAWSPSSTASSRAASWPPSPTSEVLAPDAARAWPCWPRSSGTSGASTTRPSTSRYFRNPGSPPPIGMVGMVFFAMMGAMFFLAFYLQIVRGFSPLQAGVLMMPFAAAQLIFAPLSQRVVERFGGQAVGHRRHVGDRAGAGQLRPARRRTPRSGCSRSSSSSRARRWPTSCRRRPPPIMAALPREKAGVGSAMSNTVRQVGGALGVAVLGSVLSSVYRGEIAPALTGPARPRPGTSAGESIMGTVERRQGARRARRRRMIAARLRGVRHGMHVTALVVGRDRAGRSRGGRQVDAR